MEQKIVQNVFTTRSWSFGNNIPRNRNTKAMPKIEKYVYYIPYSEYLLFLYIFSHIGSIIP